MSPSRKKRATPTAHYDARDTDDVRALDPAGNDVTGVSTTSVLGDANVAKHPDQNSMGLGGVRKQRIDLHMEEVPSDVDVSTSSTSGSTRATPSRGHTLARYIQRFRHAPALSREVM